MRSSVAASASSTRSAHASSPNWYWVAASCAAVNRNAPCPVMARSVVLGSRTDRRHWRGRRARWAGEPFWPERRSLVGGARAAARGEALKEQRDVAALRVERHDRQPLPLLRVLP